MIQKYRKKPTVIEAMRWTGSNLDEILKWTGGGGGICRSEVSKDDLWLTTIDDVLVPCPRGHWIIPEPRPNRYYPCDPSVFVASYEQVDDDDT